MTGARCIAELTHHKRVATDGPAEADLIADGDRLRALRVPLTEFERERWRDLGRALTQAVEATCRAITPGDTEAEVAGQVAHRLWREGIVPVDVRVAADDRPARYRSFVAKGVPIERRATISVVGRRHGLCAAVTRVVSFGRPTPKYEAEYLVASMVDATFLFFSRPGEPISEIFRRARRIYEKMDQTHEWTRAYQGHQIGYASNEGILLPDDPTPLRSGQVLCWSPTVHSTRFEDTIVVHPAGFEIPTVSQDWPQIAVSVKGVGIERPGVLRR